MTPWPKSCATTPKRGYGWNANYIGTRPTNWTCYGTSCPNYPNETNYVSTGDQDYTGVKIFTEPWYFGPAQPERGKGSFFNLKPRYKTHAAGDPVRYDECLMLTGSKPIGGQETGIHS